MNPAHGVRARHRINGWMNSCNHLTRDVRVFGYVDQRDKIGNGIDYVFASNWLKVPEYKMVLNYNPSTLRVVGTLPSDHNMVRGDDHCCPEPQANGSGSPIIETAWARAAVSRRRWCWRQSTS